MRELGLTHADAGRQGLQPDAAAVRGDLPAFCAILTEARVAVTPMGGALRFGGTMELAGMDEAINPRACAASSTAVPRYFPDFTPATSSA